MKETDTPTPEQNNLQGYFEPFTWTPSADRLQHGYVDFIAEVNDITRGVETILQIIEISSNDRDNDTRPLISNYHEGNLMRFAITSTKMISDKASELLFNINEKAYQESKK